MSYKTLPGAKLRDQQALLLRPKGQPAPPPAPGAAAATPRALVLPSSGGGYSPLSPGRSPLRTSPRFGGPTSPASPLSRSFDRAPAWAEDSVSEVGSLVGRLGGAAGGGSQPGRAWEPGRRGGRAPPRQRPGRLLPRADPVRPLAPARPQLAGRAHGLAGLGNLGNTCFMNSRWAGAGVVAGREG